MMYWIEHEHNLKVNIPENVWAKMLKFCSDAYPNECGGILIGEYSNDLKLAKIKEIMISNSSVGGKVTFLREAKEANNFLKQLWKLACGTKYFIGEWHSHPNGHEGPSWVDDDAMYKIAKSKKCSCRRPILIILNGSPKIWQANRCWVYLAERKRLELNSFSND